LEFALWFATMPEVAAAFSRVSGKPVTYTQTSFEDFQQQAGEEMTVMYRWFEAVGYSADLARLERDFFAPTDLESYLREQGWAEPARIGFAVS
jgi:hypothetical protein